MRGTSGMTKFSTVKQPNVVFVFADQWRAQATGYSGNPDVRTPHLDALARQSVNFTHAVSGCPVCTPYRASLLTGQYPLTHGLFMNDVCLSNRAVSLAQALTAGGYDTAYIGKWHVDGHGRSVYIPPERRQGFDYWKVLECTHDYRHSAYYEGNSAEKRYWPGYDAEAQTADAQAYLRAHTHADKPFLLVVSWAPPHDPYGTAPDSFRQWYDPQSITLPSNVPESLAGQARERIAGYYAHVSALDACVGRLVDTLRETGLEQDTLLVFTSDHGDMLGSQGQWNKQRPYEESIRVPFLLRYPGMSGWTPHATDVLIDAPDIMPTLLNLCHLPVPETVEGRDCSPQVQGHPAPVEDAALILCVQPFGQFTRMHHGGREFRGIRTKRHTYVRSLDGPWLLYDNREDPFQLHNRVADPAFEGIRLALEDRLQAGLKARNDSFLPGSEYVRRWGYPLDETGTVPYSN
ncbi:MAG: sulfatase [Lentisphaerae bacterium RIFOXYB12_FULL_60_10]|nr:MAG: sulfatase [Lentisphaerae bacterium RIFOXYB12_FULL_60_10]